MNDADTWTVALGAVLPPAIALINQARWPSQLRAIVALVVCFVATTLVVWLRGPVSWHDWRHTALLLTGATLVTYRLFWQPSKIAPSIEVATSTQPLQPR